ncbi:hypothetical protein HHI36_012476 [Cryptolaemus montrouzieri]|uniref:PI-PLC X domain-containing protein 1-like n=1 Tax=Cryptolaemus montrouzieri TaxID=559131 RepID=A0ABD2NF26_9CUCU
MVQVLKSWFRWFIYFLFGSCLFEECNGIVRSTAKCGSVFITVSSLKGSYIELNWETDCRTNEIQPDTIALYNKDIRNKTQEDFILYAEIKAANHPNGFYRTRTSFNLTQWPTSWRYNSTSLKEYGPQNLSYWIVAYSDTDQIIDIQPLKLQPTWMSDNREKLQSYHLGSIVIPGTHDSGCYGGLRIIEDYVLTQDMPIWYQLVAGIRYLDLRVAYHQDEMFWVNHDFIKVRKIQIIYDQIKEFIRRSPGEIIIVDFHRFPFPSVWSRFLHEKFINYTLSQLGAYAFPKNGPRHSKGPVLEKIWSARKNIIFTYADKHYTAKYPELWDPIPQAWADTLNVDTLKKYLESSLHNKSEHAVFSALMAELTPRFIDIFTGTNTLRELANNVNSNVTKWVRDEWNRRVNIITSDYFLGNNLINVAIDINRNR